MMVSSVVSWPPCRVADDAKAAPSCYAEPPAWTRKLAIWDATLPRVPVPTTIASYQARSSMCARGGLIELVVGCVGGLRR
jgi:hypothetical protein